MRWWNWIQSIWRNWRRRRAESDSLGRRGERAAAAYLRARGHSIVAQSERGGLGEIDLITVDGRTIVFVEVKTRRSNRRGAPSDAVDLDKQARITRLALGWLKRHDLLEQSVRFDVVSMVWPAGEKRPAIEHFRGAFEATGRWQLLS